MAFATSRDEFKSRVLRALGHPHQEVNVTDEQLDDRVDDALNFFWDYHYDGLEKMYYKHQITLEDISNKYITLPDNIIGAVSVFNIGESLSSASMFSIRYQIALNDLYTLTNPSMLPYYSALQNLALIEQILMGQKPIRYNRHRNIVHLDMDWSVMNVNDYLVIEAYQIVDPEEFQDVWKDRWLFQYAQALVKRQMGTNLFKKYNGPAIVGGITFNGQALYDEAQREIEVLEQEMIKELSVPLGFLVG
jgi:hypothetical protein